MDLGNREEYKEMLKLLINQVCDMFKRVLSLCISVFIFSTQNVNTLSVSGLNPFVF